MKRVALILAVLGILCVAAGRIQAHEFRYGHGPYYGVYRAPVVIPPRVWVAPPVVVPVPPSPPAYQYPYPYYPAPSYGFYYRGRGLSIGVGF
jgi:hypothetical protein